MKARILFLLFSIPLFVFAQYDSLNIQKELNKKHLNVNNVEAESKSWDKLLTKVFDDIDWKTLFSLFVGSILTLLSQYCFDKRKEKKEKREKKDLLSSKIGKNVFLIGGTINTLAMYKVHKQYYKRAFQIEDASNDPEQKKHADDSFNKHYEKGQEQRNIEQKLDELIAELYELSMHYCYSFNKKEKDTITRNFEVLMAHYHTKSSTFEDINDLSLLAEKAIKEEKELKKRYQELNALVKEVELKLVK